MNKLIFQTETVHTINYNDWDSFIKKNFPKCPYDSIVSEEEMGNDSTFSHRSGEMDQDERIEAKKYLDGKSDGFIIYGTGDIIDLLVSYEDLPAGLYNINICW